MKITARDSFIKPGGVYTNKTYKRSRSMTVVEATIAQSIGVLVTGSFITGFLKYMGIGDSTAGIIMALPVFAGIVQVFSPMVLERRTRRMKIIVALSVIHRILLSFLGFVPLLIAQTNLRAAVFSAIYFLSYSFVYFPSPAYFTFIMALIPRSLRGRYFAFRDPIMIGVSTIVSLIIGFVLDYFKGIGNQNVGFGILFAVVGVFTVLNALALMQLKEPPVKIPSKPPKISDVMTKPLQDKHFRLVIIFTLMWAMSLNLAGPFANVFYVSTLKLEYAVIAGLGFISTTLMVAGARFWGSRSRYLSWHFILLITILLAALNCLAYVFVTAQNWMYILPVCFALSGFGISGANIAIFNITANNIPREGQTIYAGFNAFISAIVSFGSTFIGSLVIKFTGNGSFRLFGFSFGSIQLLIALQGVFLVLTGIYAVTVLNPIREQ